MIILLSLTNSRHIIIPLLPDHFGHASSEIALAWHNMALFSTHHSFAIEFARNRNGQKNGIVRQTETDSTPRLTVSKVIERCGCAFSMTPHEESPRISDLFLKRSGAEKLPKT
jgi:hypothetical protein